jgi:hypothetical protein
MTGKEIALRGMFAPQKASDEKIDRFSASLEIIRAVSGEFQRSSAISLRFVTNSFQALNPAA